MAVTATTFYRAAAPTVSTTLYTVDELASIVISEISVTNTAASPATFTILLNGVVLIPGVSIAANSIVTFDLKQELDGGDAVSGFASSSTVNFHICGVTIV